MRNDAHDEIDHVPSLSARAREEDDFSEPVAAPAAQRPVHVRGPVRSEQKPASTGPLWALVGALTIAFAGLGWWSFQQINLMEQQLVATQESFARISEEAAGRIQDISGKVVAAESSVTSGSEALKLEVKQLQRKLGELEGQQQKAVAQLAEQNKVFEAVQADVKSQQGGSTKLADALQALTSEQAELKKQQADLVAAQGDVSKLQSQLKSLNGDVTELKKIGNPGADIERLSQDLLVLRSEFDNQPAPKAAPAPKNNTAEFDAFRAQMTRSITTLQAQIRNLQDQIDAKR
ncbi:MULTISPECIES: ATPase [Pseudomonas]|uniref:ATPase n=1 Tax=Pseudomonas TaxID=286 RepID=UPI0030038271